MARAQNGMRMEMCGTREIIEMVDRMGLEHSIIPMGTFIRDSGVPIKSMVGD